MKKLFILCLIIIMALVFAACGEEAPKEDAADENTADVDVPKEEIAATYELAMVTDANDITMSSTFIQNVWQGVQNYAEKNELTYMCYVPNEVSDQGYVETISKAVNNGAKLVVLPCSLFEAAAYDVQYRYPNVSFILLDGQPRTADYKTYAIEANVNAVNFSEQEAGFLVGYALVKEGFTKLGVIGGMALPPVVRYGYGFIAGAKVAAAEDNVTGIQIRYTYSGEFSPSPEVQTLASSWYNAGTEVIFGCGGDLDESVMAAAEPVGAYVVAVDTDKSSQSSTVIASSVKEATTAVYAAIERYYNNNFHGGIIDTMNAASSGVSLKMAEGRFVNFTAEEYKIIYDKIAAGSIAIPSEGSAKLASELSDERVTVVVE